MAQQGGTVRYANVQSATLDAMDVSIAVPRMRNLFRGMKADGASPVVERSATGLGVRIGVDVAPAEDGMVGPGRGLSVAPDDPQLLPRFRRPEALGGTAKHPVWRIDEGDLPETLAHRLTSPTHGQVEPAHEVDLADYESALAATRELWTPLA
jgi:hypothetical protein